ncbi:MAG: hypothetical protein Q9190_002635 [Brigantiaea leucoxantha]
MARSRVRNQRPKPALLGEGWLLKFGEGRKEETMEIRQDRNQAKRVARKERQRWEDVAKEEISVSRKHDEAMAEKHKRHLFRRWDGIVGPKHASLEAESTRKKPTSLSLPRDVEPEYSMSPLSPKVISEFNKNPPTISELRHALSKGRPRANTYVEPLFSSKDEEVSPRIPSVISTKQNSSAFEKTFCNEAKATQPAMPYKARLDSGISMATNPADRDPFADIYAEIEEMRALGEPRLSGLTAVEQKQEDNDKWFDSDNDTAATLVNSSTTLPGLGVENVVVKEESTYSDSEYSDDDAEDDEELEDEGMNQRCLAEQERLLRYAQGNEIGNWF